MMTMQLFKNISHVNMVQNTFQSAGVVDKTFILLKNILMHSI